jgi:hypothetical protein
MPSYACSSPDPALSRRKATPGIGLPILVSCLIAAASPARADAPAHWKSVDYLVDSFIDIALGNEYEAKPGQLRKWTTPIRYALIHRVGDRNLHERLVATQMSHLAELSGLDIGPAATAESANFLIVLSGEALLQDDLQRYFGWKSAAQRDKFFRETVCLGVMRARRGQVVRGVVIIPVDRARGRGKLVACVVEELTQLLGLPNDSDLVFPSIFNDRSTDEFLSPLDIVLLRMLYDPRLKTGMNAASVRPLARQIATDLIRAGGIAQAEQAAQGGLSAFIP